MAKFMVFKFLFLVLSMDAYADNGNLCEDFLPIFAKRKTEYLKRVDASTSPDDCFSIVKEEQKKSFVIPSGCELKQLGEMSAAFKNDISGLLYLDEVSASFLNSDTKVSAIFNRAHLDLQNMIEAKCKVRDKYLEEQNNKVSKRKKNKN